MGIVEACMPNFLALGCLEVGEKFGVVGWWVGGGGILTPTLELLQPDVRLDLVRVGCNNRVT